jgi:hypothetical protein
MAEEAGVKRIAIGAVLVLALAAAGCGGGGGGSKTLSKEEYGSQLNQICKDYNARVKVIGEPTSIAELGAKGQKLLDQFNGAIAKAEKLEPPSELKAKADKFIADAKQLTGVLARLIAAAKKSDTAKVAEIGAGADALAKEGDSVARQLGAPDCAQG